MNDQPICIVCSQSDCIVEATLVSEVDKQTYQAVRCKSCGLIFTFPIPKLNANALQLIYDDEYVEGQRHIGVDNEAIKVLRDATHRQMEIVEQYVQKGTALNVGAMNGAVKVLEDRGWKLEVVEVSEHAARTAHELWGFNVSVSRIEDYDCPPEKFDFIKLGHVIEHLADPRFALERMYQMLASGGVILIDTDNADGLKTKLEVTTRKVLGETSTTALVKKLTGKNLRKRYGRLTPPEHLYCFNEKSLTTLLENVGFKILKVVKTSWGDPTWFPLVNEKFSVTEKGLLALDTIGSKFGLGEVIAVLATKN